MVAHDHIRRDQGRPPRVDMGDEHQPGVQRGRQKIADLPGTVPRPDIGMDDRRDPELVVRQRGEHPGRQPRVLTDQRCRPPRRAEHHQPVPVGHAERPAVGGRPVRAAQQFVVARVAHQQGASGRLRMGGEQLLLLPRVRDGQPGPAGFQQAVRHDPRQPVTGRTGVRHLLLEADAVGQHEDGAVAFGYVDVLAGGEDQVGLGVAHLLPGDDPAARVVQEVQHPVLNAEVGSWAKTTVTRPSPRRSAGRHSRTRTVEVTVRAATTRVFSP